MSRARERELMDMNQKLLEDNQGMAAYIEVLERVTGEAFRVANEVEEGLRLMIDPASTRACARLRGLCVAMLPIVQEAPPDQPENQEEANAGIGAGAEGAVPGGGRVGEAGAEGRQPG